MASSKYKLDISELVQGLNILQNQVEMAILEEADNGALKLQNFARENRKWRDRSGDARLRLTGGVEKSGSIYRIYLAHGVDYGIWLELAHEKRFSIIPQAIEYVGTFEIMPGFSRIMERLGGG